MQKDETIDAEIISEIVLSEIKYPVTISDITALLEEYKDIPTIDPDGDDEIVAEQFAFVLRGHKAFVKARTGIERTRKTLKQPALDYGKNVDNIAKEFQSLIKQTEIKLFVQRKIVEDNEAKKQREAEESEELRINIIKMLIVDIKSLAGIHYNSSSESLTTALEALTVPTVEVYAEFLTEAREAQQISILQLQEMRKSKKLAEKSEEFEVQEAKEAEKLRDEQDAKIAKERAEFAEEKAEFERQKNEMENEVRAKQEELDLINAEKEADALMLKQQEFKKEKETKDKELQDLYYNEAYDSLNAARQSENEALLDLIIEGKVKHIKFEVVL